MDNLGIVVKTPDTVVLRGSCVLIINDFESKNRIYGQCPTQHQIFIQRMKTSTKLFSFFCHCPTHTVPRIEPTTRGTPVLVSVTRGSGGSTSPSLTKVFSRGPQPRLIFCPSVLFFTSPRTRVSEFDE